MCHALNRNHIARTIQVNQELLESQILGLTRRKNSINGKPTSLHDLGYSSIGLDDGWQACGHGVNGSYHDEHGDPLVDKSKFPSLSDMTAKGHAANVTMGWYGESNRTFPFIFIEREDVHRTRGQVETFSYQSIGNGQIITRQQLRVQRGREGGSLLRTRRASDGRIRI